MLHAIKQELSDMLADAVQETAWDIRQRLRPGRDSRYIPVALKRRVVADGKCRCYLCQRTGTQDTGPDGRGWHIDHIVAIAKGGQTTYSNLALSCATCNQRKAAR